MAICQGRKLKITFNKQKTVEMGKVGDNTKQKDVEICPHPFSGRYLHKISTKNHSH